MNSALLTVAFLVTTQAVGLAASAFVTSDNPRPECIDEHNRFPLLPEVASTPVAFRDSHTGILLYAETDGRHLAAFEADGTLLWIRNPFEDSKLCPYRTVRPKISRILPIERVYQLQAEKYWGRKGPFVQIEFNSSQFGAIDLKNGDFFGLGQN